MYYGAFLPPFLAAFAVGWLIVDRAHFRGLLATGGIAVLVASIAVLPYVSTYVEARRQLSPDVAVRGTEELARYSPTFASYLSTPATNLIFGWTANVFGRNEGRLFPGMTVLLLGLIGLARGRLTALGAASVCALVFSVDASLGVHGWSFPLMTASVPGFAAIRAPARYAQLGLACLALLAGIGLTHLLNGSRRSRSLAAALVLLLGAEFWTVPSAYTSVEPNQNELSRWLGRQRPGAVVFQWPAPDPAALPDPDPAYVFESTKHWCRMINGYSGFYPQPYLDLLGAARDFPTTRTLDDLRRLGATLLIVHPWRMTPSHFSALNAEVARRGPRLEGCFEGPFGVACVYDLVRMAP
jgi:hypothetical protein